MKDYHHRKIFKILGTIILLLALFLGLPMIVYAMMYGFKSFELFHMIGYSGSWLMMDLFINIFPIIMYSTFGLIGIGFLITVIFLQKKWAYRLLLILSWIFCFFSLLFIVVKTYSYEPRFIISVLAGTVLVVGGFLSWFTCFWGYKQKKLLAYWIPLSIRVVSVIIAYILLSIFSDPEMLVNYINFPRGIEKVFYLPWILDTKELVFAGLFFIVLRITRLMVESVLFYSELSQKRKYNRKLFGILVLLISIVLSVIVYIKRDLVVAPKYDVNQYQNILIKKGYQANISTGDNVFYRQNEWLLNHTGFLDKINQNPYIVQNYNSQTGIIQSGFDDFWQNFSGNFRNEFSDIALVSSGDYSMIPIDLSHYDSMGFPEEKLRERTILINSVATQLCRLGECQEGFSYRKDRFVFVNKRLQNGAGVTPSLISAVTVQRSFSGLQEIIPYLSLLQKEELQGLLIPYDINYLYHNVIVQEYHFVYAIAIESSKYFIQVRKISAPKFLLDLDYTDYLIQKYFVEALSMNHEELNYDDENMRKLSYNILGNRILNVMLPRVSTVYNHFENLENQRRDLYDLIQE